MALGFVISDLHILSSRSSVEDHIQEIESLMQRAAVCVINGDCFDFRWAVIRDRERCLAAAGEWVADKLNRFPGCRFYFIAGNQDGLTEFVARLKLLAARFPNLEVREDFLQLGDKLFLHGDVIHLSDLQRERNEHLAGPSKGWLANALYDFYAWSGLSRMHAALISKAGAARKILEYFSREAPEQLSAARHVYFGHTHSPFENFSYQGMLFHNSGAVMRGLRFKILSFEV